MPGNMTKAKALEWLTKYGSISRGYPQEPAAAYIGLGVKRFRDGVAANLLPQPRRHGKRLVWDKLALDRYMDGQINGDAPTPDHTIRSWRTSMRPNLPRYVQPVRAKGCVYLYFRRHGRRWRLPGRPGDA